MQNQNQALTLLSLQPAGQQNTKQSLSEDANTAEGRGGAHRKHRRQRSEQRGLDELQREVELQSETILQLSAQCSEYVELIRSQQDRIASDLAYIATLKEKTKSLRMQRDILRRRQLIAGVLRQGSVQTHGTQTVEVNIGQAEAAPSEVAVELQLLQQNLRQIKVQLLALKQTTLTSRIQVQTPNLSWTLPKPAPSSTQAVSQSLTTLLSARLSAQLGCRQALAMLEDFQTQLNECKYAVEQQGDDAAGAQLAVQRLALLLDQLGQQNQHFAQNEAYLSKSVLLCGEKTEKKIEALAHRKSDEINFLECFFGVVLYIRDVAANTRALDDVDEICSACEFDSQQRGWFEVVFGAVKRAVQL